MTRTQVRRRLTRNATDQCQSGSSNLLSPYREQPRSTRSVVAYPRPAFSATELTNHARISFDQQGQVAQGHCMQKNKENCSNEVHGGGGLELEKPAREPASSRPKPCPSPKNTPGILPVCRSLLALVGRKQTVVRDQFSRPKSPGSRL